MTVDELRTVLAALPPHLDVAVAVLQPIGVDIEPDVGITAGVTYDLDRRGNCRRIWLTATPTRLGLPSGADYRCGCGEPLRYTEGDLERQRTHDDCE